MIRFLFVFFLTISLACCTTIQEGHVFNPMDAYRIKVGETTEAEVEKMLGPPRLVFSRDGDKAALHSWKQTMVSPLSRTSNWQGAAVVIVYDKTGVVKKVDHDAAMP